MPQDKVAAARPVETDPGLMPDLEFVLDYVDRLREAVKQGNPGFDRLGCYCTFIGYPRSGHTIIGSLLDAHPDIVLAHELNALRCLEAGFDQPMIFRLILDNTELFNRRNRDWTGYNYQVAGQWQGRFRDIRVIGDKKGGGTIARLLRNPGLLQRLESTIAVPTRYIHVVRNPYDNIATMAARGDISLDQAVDRYFNLVKGVLYVRRHAGQRVLDVGHEAFIANPAAELRRMCEFLGVAAEDGWLGACAAIVKPAPHRTRFETGEWTPARRARVAGLMQEVEFLRGYGFDD